MGHTVTVAALIGCVSLLYSTAGQAGGTAFIAVMAFARFPANDLRPTALLLNVVAAGYATWRLYRRRVIEPKLLLPLVLPSVFTSFIGGLLSLTERVYFVVTGFLLVAGALLMIFKRTGNSPGAHPIQLGPAAAVGAAVGFVSGLTGIGGGVFVTPVLIALDWASPRRGAALSPPFILCNSIVGLLGVLIAGQKVAPGTPLYSIAAIVGAGLGTAIGFRWMSERVTRYVLALILLFAGLRMVLG